MGLHTPHPSVGETLRWGSLSQPHDDDNDDEVLKIYGVGWKPILVSKGPNKTSFAMKSESVDRFKKNFFARKV